MLGFGAIVIPFFAPGAVKLALAWVFFVGGWLRIVHAFQSHPSQGFWLKLSTGLLYEVASFLLFTKLIEQNFSLSALLGLILLIKGLLEVAMVSRLQLGSSRNWVLISGLISIGLGVLLITNLKLGAAWLLGLLVGVSFITSGIWFIMLTLELQRSTSRQSRRKNR